MITYSFRSPLTRADSRKSRVRKERVCERSWRAPYDQPRAPRTMTSVNRPEFFSYAAMTMISGKIGITSSTSVTSDSAPSAIPPRYAAETPMSTANAVARPPTPNAMMIDWRVPQISCERTSWPYAVVPNQWWLDDPSPGRKSVACGSCGAICPGKIASTRKNTSRISPASALRFREIARQMSTLAPRRASPSGGSGPVAAVGSAAVIAVTSGPGCGGRARR